MTNQKWENILRNISAIFPLCPACQSKNVFCVKTDVFCCECDWMSHKEHMEGDDMDNVFADLRARLAADPESELAELFAYGWEFARVQNEVPSAEPLESEDLFSAEVTD